MIKIELLQIEAKIADIEFNKNKIIEYYNNSEADLILTPESFLTSYTALDHFFDETFQKNTQKAIQDIVNITNEKTLALSTAYVENNICYNCCFIIKNKKIEHIIYKSRLATYGIFNESRYYDVKLDTNNIITIKNTKIAIVICEDVWRADKIQELKDLNPELLISLNASPFEINKHQTRLEILKNAQEIINVPNIYLNSVGSSDNLVFDGSSIILNKNSELVSVLKHAKEDVVTCTYNNKELTVVKPLYYSEDKLALVYNVLIKGTRDFIKKCNFKGVIIGISGGIDSTLTAAIAADALGSENIIGVSMPSKYTSEESIFVINEIKEKLGIKIIEIPISDTLNQYDKALSGFMNLNDNNIAENLQARIRGNLLMAIANNNPNFMLLTTGNKSELATGYSTLYGDTCGFFNIIKDLYKTQVFELSKWRNKHIPEFSITKIKSPIPKLAITRKPSAELKDNQNDEDSLMEYAILDAILYELIEKQTPLDNVKIKFDVNLVEKAYKLLHNSQYKRIQSAIGIKISIRPFDKDFYYPLAK